MQLNRQLSSLIVAASIAFAPVAASAEPPPDPPTNPTDGELGRAKELFDNGKGLYAEGSYSAAIAAFRQAYALSGDPVLLYNIALAHDRAGDFESALEYLGYYRAFAPESERAALAEKEDSLRKRRLRSQNDAAEADKQTDDADGDEAASDTVEEPTANTDEPTDTVQPTKQKIFTVPVWVATGLSVVGLGVGAGLGIAALGRSSDADALCMQADGGTVCPQSAESDAESARRMGIGADVALGVGAAAGIVAIVLIARNASKRKKANNAAALVPHAGGAGVQVRF